MGRYDLGLGEEEFWALTVRELNALIERYKNNQDWLNYRSALICAVMANMWRDSKRQAFTPDDFMPKEKVRQQSPEQMLATVKLLNTALGGRVLED